MARALQDILTELHAVYNPQRDQYNTQISAVDPQAQAEEQGLQAAKTDAFSQIETAANRRGIFYGGMPIAEEQRYTGQNFLPSLANMRAKYAQQKFDLVGALNKVTSDEYSQAEGIHQTELDRDEKQRQFDAQLAAQAAAAKAAAAGGVASPSFGSFGATGGAAPKAAGGGANVPAGMQALYNQVFIQPNGQAWSDQALVNDYNATYKSAQYGNTRDQQKLQLYHSIRPDLFGAAMPAKAVGFNASY